ncbi:hypothetical protein GCM10025876_27330 [Demequina litorisediminis]|uniref:SecA family profile domain-containing protein n=1 Tax=Demequina litorisediminis TaxID=1849022 RepID=A0ABQ6IFL7_9MICO|nr:hypothetical protein GCM10025876_27330 [Demequina litorisediminis]
MLDEDYEVEEKKRAVGMLEPGIEKVERALGIENLYEPQNTPLIGFLNNAVKAKELFRRDRDYVVQAGEVDIVDEHTGRLLKGRRYSEGLHQAIEAKEGVPIKAENQTYASITLQNYFRQYDKARGHDRYRTDRGGRAFTRRTALAWCRFRRTSRCSAWTRRISCTRPRPPSSTP